MESSLDVNYVCEQNVRIKRGLFDECLLLFRNRKSALCIGSSCHKLRRELTLDRATSQFFASGSLSF